MGERAERERTCIQPEFRCAGWVDARGLPHAFRWGVDKGQPKVSGSQPWASHAGYYRRVENKAPGLKGGEGRGRGHLMVPIQARVLGPVHGCSAGG